ncbi:MAG: DUF2280 domain-containing protein [Pseudomonadota bacterium]
MTHQRTPKLNDAVKAFIVHALACFDTPSDVAEAVKAEFGVTVTRQAVERYDPTKYAGRKLGTKWRLHFEVARKAFMEQLADIPIAHRACRLRALHRMFQRAEQTKNFALAAALLEQAAKEVGDVFTNRRSAGAPRPVTARSLFAPAVG